MKPTVETSNKQNQSQAAANRVSKEKNNSRGDSDFVDNRPETKALKSLQMMINGSSRMVAQRQTKANIIGSTAHVPPPLFQTGGRDKVIQKNNLPTVTIGQVNSPNTPATVRRIPPRVNTDAAITVAGWHPPMNFITLSIEGAGGGNGTATINGANTYNITSSETVQLRGVNQTNPGNAGNLKLVAHLGTTRLAESNAFSVAAYPIQINFNFNSILSPLNYMGVKFWGASYDVDFVSDSGTKGDCNETKVSENVIVTTATGWWSGVSTTTSNFIQTTSPQTDRHADGGYSSAADMQSSMDSADLPGSQKIVSQFFRFACGRSGIAEDKAAGPKVPTSGFKITRTMSKTTSPTKYYVHVKKEGFANNAVNAGTVDDTAVKNAEVKD